MSHCHVSRADNEKQQTLHEYQFDFPNACCTPRDKDFSRNKRRSLKTWQSSKPSESICSHEYLKYDLLNELDVLMRIITVLAQDSINHTCPLSLTEFLIRTELDLDKRNVVDQAAPKVNSEGLIIKSDTPTIDKAMPAGK